MMGDRRQQTPRKAVVVSLNDLKDCQLFMPAFFQVPLLILLSASVPFEKLEEAFGPSSLGILIVKDLPAKFVELRHKLLSNASYLANLPSEDLGIATSTCIVIHLFL